MKKSLLILTFAVATVGHVFAQGGQAFDPGVGPDFAAQPAVFERFNLDFPGGSPLELLAAIEKARGKAVNAIVPKDFENTELPPLKMRDVAVEELFDALQLASSKTERLPGGNVWTKSPGYGFKTQQRGPNAVWYFFQDRFVEPPQPKFCRFYNISEELNTYRIEDITTTIKTGWDLLGIKEQPTLKFHPETKLLIAVGPRDQLDLIEAALDQLKPKKAPQKGGNEAEAKTSVAK